LFSWKKTGDLFLVITVRVSAISSQKLATFFCSSLSFHSGVAHFSGMQKFAAPFVGPLLVGAPVRPNMLNMPKSAAERARVIHNQCPLRRVSLNIITIVSSISMKHNKVLNTHGSTMQ